MKTWSTDDKVNVYCIIDRHINTQEDQKKFLSIFGKLKRDELIELLGGISKVVVLPIIMINENNNLKPIKIENNDTTFPLILSEVEKVRKSHYNQYNEIEVRKQKIDTIIKYLRANLGTDLNRIQVNEVKNLQSVKSFRRNLKMDEDIIRETIKAYIIDIFGIKYLDLIYEKYWFDPSKITLSKKTKFIKLLNEQWDQSYPDNLRGFDSITDLSKKLNIKKRETIVKWLKAFFEGKLSELGLSKSNAIKLYNEYTKLKRSTSRQRSGSKEIERKVVNWGRIEKKVIEHGWKIDYPKMNEEKFNSIKGFKNKGRIKIPLFCNSKESHFFIATVDQIFYCDTRCSHCFKDYSDRLKKIGKNIHPILSLLVLLFFYDNKIIGLYEHLINPSTSDRKGTKHMVEVFLPNKNEFGKLIKGKLLRGEDFPDSINEIVIDFTLHIHPYLLDKLFKHYQQSNRFLIIVVFGTFSKQGLEDLNKEIREDPIFKYPEHVKVISLQEFIEFFGIDSYKRGFYQLKIKWAESIAESAINNESIFKKLATIYERIRPILNKAKEIKDYKLLFNVLNTMDRFIGKMP